jgi:DNA (cytosine-5)-methyltransferase 1
MDHGLAKAGFRHLAFCESDAYRRDVLTARWPGVPIHEDVREFGGGMVGRRHGGDDTEPAGLEGRDDIDLLCGGFPCQDLSVAGQRKGLAGDRSGLFHEFARIAELVRPRWLLVENVPGLLSSQGGRDFGTVIGTLADIGYGVAWRILDSRYFGVPQRRRRVFIVGALAHGDPRAAAERAGQVLAVGARCPRHPTTRGEMGTDVAFALADGSGSRTGSGRDSQDTLVASLSGLGTGGPDDNDGQAGRVIATSITLASDPISAEELAQPSTKRNGDPGVVQVGASVRRLMPVECERLQALPDQWTDLGNTPDSKRYAALGDAVTASVAEWIGRRLLDTQAEEG